jgi:transposase
METLYFLGIDISKKNFQAALTVDGMNMYSLEIENTSISIKEFMKELRGKFGFGVHQLIVCMEHTGIYCHPLLDYLVKNKIKVCVEPALQIKQSQGMTRGKTDQVDAKRIAQYAYKNRDELRFWKPQRLFMQKLKALLTVRDRLIKVKVQLETPLNEMAEFVEKSIQKEVIKNCQNTLNGLKRDISKVEEQIDKLIIEDQQIKDQMTWATSVPGVGKITALNVIMVTGEFERITEAKKLACYAGVAPFEHSSGSSIRGKTRVSKMANMTLKKLLHLAAMSAIQCCEEIRVFYLRKVAEGKNKMSVINAVRNKLISRIFACVKNKRRFEKVYQNALA